MEAGSGFSADCANKVSAMILLLVIWIRSKLSLIFFQVNYELCENQSSQMKLL